MLEGIDNELSIGQGVELQWRFHQNSPFGWWYTEVEKLAHVRCGTSACDACDAKELDRYSNGNLAVATLVFPQFVSDSNWYRMKVMFGDGNI